MLCVAAMDLAAVFEFNIFDTIGALASHYPVIPNEVCSAEIPTLRVKSLYYRQCECKIVEITGQLSRTNHLKIVYEYLEHFDTHRFKNWFTAVSCPTILQLPR